MCAGLRRGTEQPLRGNEISKATVSLGSTRAAVSLRQRSFDLVYLCGSFPVLPQTGSRGLERPFGGRLRADIRAGCIKHYAGLTSFRRLRAVGCESGSTSRVYSASMSQKAAAYGGSARRASRKTANRSCSGSPL